MTGCRLNRSAPGAGCSEQRPAKEAVVDGAQLYPAVALALFELGGTQGGDEIVVMLVAVFDPRSRRRRELGRAIDLLDVDEPGALEEVALGEVRSNRHGSGAMSAAT
jgi:hypothetical protein